MMDPEIWKVFDELKEELKEEKSCNHEDTFIDCGCSVCLECGQIVSSNISELVSEWNNYKNDDGSYQNNCQRADLYVSDNPYALGGTIPGFNKNSYIMRLHYQQVFSHKQKTYWKISEKFMDYCTLIGLPTSDIVTTAKKMWHICMESGKLTRAGVRNGLIGSCLYYACVYCNVPIDRQKIIETVDGDNKGFLKGEKVFCEIMEGSEYYKSITKKTIDIKENDSFYQYCVKLEIPLRASKLCDEIYSKNLYKLDSVTPKSAIAGVLYYVVKHTLNLKRPSKSKVSEEINVCIPTINKVLNILEK